MSHYYPYSLSVDRLRLQLLLGVDKHERLAEQPVEVSICFYFAERLEVCDTDKGVFVCYDDICRRLIDYVKGREFRLIEYLCQQLHAVIREALQDRCGSDADGIAVSLSINKCSPPVPYDISGVAFSYSDLPEGAIIRS